MTMSLEESGKKTVEIHDYWKEAMQCVHYRVLEMMRYFVLLMKT